MDGFEAFEVQTGETTIFGRRGGDGPPLLLLHGFPETHLMWREIAPMLAADFTIISADLRGYGSSGCPPSKPDHSPYSKRAMAQDMIEVMTAFGFERFGVAGHDRGGRVAYRMALDHPERVNRLAVLDILPGAAMWDRADWRFALAFWPWSFLAQPEPLPEQLLAAGAEMVVDHAIAQWGTPPSIFPPKIRAAYYDALGAPEHVHAICEEYRAAAGIDRQHDEVDRKTGRKIRCPTLVLWSATGALGTWYEKEGGPLQLWRQWADDVQGNPVDGGHFFPEEQPSETAAKLKAFFSAGGAGRAVAGTGVSSAS